MFTTTAIAELLDAQAGVCRQLEVAAQAIGTFSHPTEGLIASAVRTLADVVREAKDGLAAQVAMARHLVADLARASAEATAEIAAALAAVGVAADAPVDPQTGRPVETPPVRLHVADPVEVPQKAAPAAPAAPRPQPQYVAAANAPVSTTDAAADTEAAFRGAFGTDEDADAADAADAAECDPSALTGAERDEYIRAEIRRDPDRSSREIHAALAADGIRVGNKTLLAIIREVRGEDAS